MTVEMGELGAFGEWSGPLGALSLLDRPLQFSPVSFSWRRAIDPALFLVPGVSTWVTAKGNTEVTEFFQRQGCQAVIVQYSSRMPSC